MEEERIPPITSGLEAMGNQIFLDQISALRVTLCIDAQRALQLEFFQQVKQSGLAKVVSAFFPQEWQYFSI